MEKSGKEWRDTGEDGSDTENDKKLEIHDIVQSVNVAKLLSSEMLCKIGQDAIDGYKKDLESRNEWTQRNSNSIKLALQVVEAKNFPWINASNVKFPLVTIAALQFLARISILTKGRNLVRCDFIGGDIDGQKYHRAKRIGEHMSYQLLEEDTEWVDDDEKAKLSASIIGCAFKKTHYDSIEGITISEFVPAPNLVVDYFTKSFKKANRVSHLIDMSENDMHERYRSGKFLELQEGDTSKSNELIINNDLQSTADMVQGTTRPQDDDTITPFSVVEQHTWIDLDGDGYKEPYIVWVKSDSAQVLRIVARFFDLGDIHRTNDIAVAKYLQLSKDSTNPESAQAYLKESESLRSSKDNHIIRIDAQNFFTKIPFIPSPDGGFYDLGLGALLGPLNAATNSIINQMIDNATQSNLSAGFMGRGVRMKGGVTPFQMGEFKTIEGTADDLKKSIMLLPVNPLSPTLFQLLELLISYGERISGATDIMSGVTPGQNTPAETSRNTIEQGMKLFSGIYQRMYRSFKKELQLRYNINRLFLSSSPRFAEISEGDGAMIVKDDYTKLPLRIFPASDPNVVSDEQRKQKASLVYGISKESPFIDKYMATKQFLESNEINGIDQLCPDPKGPNAIQPPENPKMEIEKQKIELQKQELDLEGQKAVVQLQQSAALNQAKIAELQAKANKEAAEAQGVDTGHRIALMNAEIGARRAEQDGIVNALKILQETVDQRHRHSMDSSEKQQKEPEVDDGQSDD